MQEVPHEGRDMKGTRVTGRKKGMGTGTGCAEEGEQQRTRTSVALCAQRRAGVHSRDAPALPITGPIRPVCLALPNASLPTGFPAIVALPATHTAPGARPGSICLLNT